MGNVPVNEGEEIQVKVDSVGGRGDGIARVQGFVIFVPNTQVGDYVQVRVTKVSDKAAWAEVVKKVEKPKDENEKLVENLKDDDFSEDF